MGWGGIELGVSNKGKGEVVELLNEYWLEITLEILEYCKGEVGLGTDKESCITQEVNYL